MTRKTDIASPSAGESVRNAIKLLAELPTTAEARGAAADADLDRLILSARQLQRARGNRAVVVSARHPSKVRRANADR